VSSSRLVCQSLDSPIKPTNNYLKDWYVKQHKLLNTLRQFPCFHLWTVAWKTPNNNISWGIPPNLPSGSNLWRSINFLFVRTPWKMHATPLTPTSGFCYLYWRWMKFHPKHVYIKKKSSSPSWKLFLDMFCTKVNNFIVGNVGLNSSRVNIWFCQKEHTLTGT